MMKKFVGLLCGVMMLVIGMISTGGALTLSSVSGTWTGTQGGSNVNYSTATVGYGNGTEYQVRWGDPGPSGEQSGLGFTGIAPPSISFQIGDPFEIGQLCHFNHQIAGGSEATEAYLKIEISFSDPVGLTAEFNFTFDINETPNTTGDPYQDADIITFPSSYPSETFSINGVEYTLQLLGFGDSADNLINSFSSPEDGTNVTKLWGKIITPPPTTVPIPSTVLLLGSGLVGLVGFSRKRFSRGEA